MIGVSLMVDEYIRCLWPRNLLPWPQGRYYDRAVLGHISRLLGIALVALVTLSATPFGQPSPAPAPTTQAPDTPSVNEIMAHAMARAESQDETSAELWFESLILTTVDTLDGDDQVTETLTSLHKRYPFEGALYEEMVQRDGEPLDDDDLREEQKRKEEFRKEAVAAAESGDAVETDDERQLRFDDELMGRYRAEVTGQESVRGEPCWVVDFEPREGKLPENTRMDKVLNRSTGRVYVSRQDHGIMRIEFELREPVRYMWGMIASLSRARGQLDFSRVEPNIWLPHKFDMRIDIRVFFRTTRRRVVRQWVERQRIAGRVPGTHGERWATGKTGR